MSAAGIGSPRTKYELYIVRGKNLDLNLNFAAVRWRREIRPAALADPTA